MRAITHEEAVNEIFATGFTLITSIYLGSTKKHTFMCTENHKFERTYSNFKSNPSCPICNKFKSSKPITEEELISRSFKLIEWVEPYQNVETQFWCECSNKHKFKTSTHNFRSGGGCRYCFSEKGRSRRLNIDNVRNYIESEGYKLLSKKYKNNRQKLKLICPSGHTTLISFNEFKDNNSRCTDCYYLSKFGETNPNYNHDLTDEERTTKRYTHGYAQWRKSVYSHDAFTCQKCGKEKSGIFEAHHILPWRLFPELRFDPNNGITLCKSCHKQYHSIYGSKDNCNRKTLETFLSGTIELKHDQLLAKAKEKLKDESKVTLLDSWLFRDV